ncbi:uncharacterized protein VTP21DRAFT_2471 [Calcarisporiella thermophila]|uniref:uncharacterized protein n=1 Tax=Calcarisporiella thermophila TaxID=911321 RepID=UPI0037422F2C
MVSPLVNVARWSALGLGIVYGAYHRSSLTRAEERHRIEREWQHKQELIEKGRAEYARRKAEEAGRAAGGIITNPEDPGFDLEKAVAYLESQEKK